MANRVGALTKKFGKMPCRKEAKRLTNMSRNNVRNMVGIFTGHCALRKHLHRIGVASDSLCECCGGEDEESVLHFLGECNAFCRLRKEHLGREYASMKVIRKIGSDALSKYIAATERFKI